ncbi:hypothetical protein [Methylomagnum ishizawai]|uniref:hypothetical protein n=1 Tax=Methylomagnum ishizawai TaxID=1760988 RepID=UPI001C3433DE|nr:hypothetical protein [Methylomagnum ishizawai]BBL77560.1 hypothetical protein MishRS11D_46580 [Methylomagnum ishizawai]
MFPANNGFGGSGMPARNPMQQAGYELASAVALLTAFVITPVILDWTGPVVERFVLARYGEDFVGLGSFVFGGCIGYCIFSVAKAFMLLALAAITLRAAFAFV